MTKEQSFFIRILSDHLNGRETEHVDGLDWAIIHEYALKHQVNGIVYTQVMNFMPEGIKNTFCHETIATLYYASIRENDFDAVQKELKKEGVSYFIVKGPVIADLYPNPKLRVMGDIDMVIHRDNRDECNDILLRNGYECKTNQSDREWQYYKNKMELELHDRLVYEESINEEGHDAYFNDCWKYVKDGQLDWNFHFLFLIFHLRKHFMNSGVGFRQFMDLAVVVQKMNIDWTWMEQNLKETGLYSFAKKCFGFIDRWFGIKAPLIDRIDDDFFEEATQKIFADGVFGFNNIENETNSSVNEARNKRFPKLSLFHQFIREIFPPLKLLSQTTAYGYLEKNKILLPFAWIHRWIRSIKGFLTTKGKVLSSKKKVASMQHYNRRMIMMKKWGILNDDE